MNCSCGYSFCRPVNVAKPLNRVVDAHLREQTANIFGIQEGQKLNLTELQNLASALLQAIDTLNSAPPDHRTINW